MAVNSVSRFLSIFVLILFLIGVTLFAAGDSTDVRAGYTYYQVLDADMLSNNWAGMEIYFSGTSPEQAEYLYETYFPNAEMRSVPLAGSNFDDGVHYYAAMKDSLFDTSRIGTIAPSDISDGGFFDTADFPQFDPIFSNYNDNPYDTFAPGGIPAFTQIMIDGINHTAIQITIGSNPLHQRQMYLLKYTSAIDEQPTPLFVSKIEGGSCYLGTYCVAEFMFPKSATHPYRFFAISKFPVYELTTYVDSVESVTFSQTGKPYTLGIEVKGLYDQLLKPDIDVVIVEENGMNNFIPTRLSGVIGTSYALGITDGSGFETFLVAPTKGVATSNYDIYAAVLYQGELTSREQLSVTSFTSLDSNLKPVTPTELRDDVKSSITAASQITENLFKILSNGQVKKVTLYYELSNGSYSLRTPGNAVTMLKTGAPNMLSLQVTSGGSAVSGYTARIKEKDGYLIINPATAGTVYTPKERNQYMTISQTGELPITPTSYGPRTTTITAEIFDPSDNKINEVILSIDNELETSNGDYSAQSESTMASFVTAMSMVQDNLFSVVG